MKRPPHRWRREMRRARRAEVRAHARWKAAPSDTGRWQQLQLAHRWRVIVEARRVEK